MQEGCCCELWEAAYSRFATPDQEVRKFIKRLKRVGAAQWPRTAEIVELFCGRGNGLHALYQLGFTRVEGVDRSTSLLRAYSGPATCYRCDCRQLPFANGSKDIVIIQGGLHHLPALPDDLEQTLLETKRVLRNGGRCVIVEPWLTPFLSFVHMVCRNPIARRVSRKIDALATMMQCEQQTYKQWLGQPRVILSLLTQYFRPEWYSIAWGKLFFVGQKES